MFYTSKAKIRYDWEQDILRAELSESNELVRYLKQLYLKASWNTKQMWTSRHGAHITIYRPAAHGFVKNNPARYDGDLVLFQYNPEEIYEGGYFKGFLGFYLPVYSPDIEQIKDNLGIIEGQGDSLHLTLFTNKWIKSQSKINTEF